MEVHFATNVLQRCYEDSTKAVQAWGPDVARKYIQRIEILYAAKQFEDLHRIRSLRLHRLAGPRGAQYAVSLHDRWRLILMKEGDDGVEVKEVTNHYGD